MRKTECLISSSLFLLLDCNSSFLCFDSSFSSGDHFSLGLLLSFNELSLLALCVSLDLFCLFGLFLLGWLLLTIGLFVVLSALEPVHEFLDKASHSLSSAHILELGVPIKLDLAAVPADEELILNNAVVIELLAESRSELLLVLEHIKRSDPGICSQRIG